MRRDLDLVRAILKTCADSTEPVTMGTFTDDTHTAPLVAYHIDIMQEAGLIDATIIRDINGRTVHATIDSLTWQGNDFLDAVRSDSLWAKTKQRIAATFGSVSFDVVKALAVSLATKSLGI